MNLSHNKPNYVFCFVDAVKCFDQKCILDHVNFKFECKKNYLLKGNSGVGKTTILNLLFGLDQLDDGFIHREDNLSVEYLFQDILLFSNLTVMQNLWIKYISSNLIGNPPEDLFYAILEQVGLSSTIGNRQIHSLSGGEQRRIQLAQILLKKPDVILLHEPTSNLDTDSTFQIMDLLDSNFSDTTKIIVSHDFEELGDEYTVLKLEEGIINHV